MIDILDILQSKAPMLKMVLSAIKATIARTDNQTLTKWLTCYSEISKAVVDKDSSEEQYEKQIEPYIRQILGAMHADTSK
jgi:hypothetical protein